MPLLALRFTAGTTLGIAAVPSLLRVIIGVTTIIFPVFVRNRNIVEVTGILHAGKVFALVGTIFLRTDLSCFAFSVTALASREIEAFPT